MENEFEEMKEDIGLGVIKFIIIEDIKILIEDFICLVYRRFLLKLASINVNKICSIEEFNFVIIICIENIRLVLYIYWVFKFYYFFNLKN